MKKISKKNKKIYSKILQLFVVIIIGIVYYLFFDIEQVPQSLYEMQTMEPNQNEAYYVEQWCKPTFGHKEFLLVDKTRVDCLSKDYAIEFDFAKKWAESIGQSLYYSKLTGKKPAVALILTSLNDYKYVKRIERLDNGIKVFLIKAY